MKARAWVIAFVVTLGVFGFGQLEAWPFTSWYMFSHVEQTPARIGLPMVVLPSSSPRVLGDDVLPYGLESHRLLARVDALRSAEDREMLCASLVRATRRRYPDAIDVFVIERTWDPLARAPGNKPRFEDSERLRCGAG